MKALTNTLNNEQGFVLIVSLLMLMVLMIIGIAATNTTTIELQISGNDKVSKMAFYAAEAARSYVEATPNLYNPGSLDPATPMNFPDPAVPGAVQSLGTSQSFSGDVVYVSESVAALRGKGFSVGEDTDMKAHVYKITSSGNGPANALSNIEAGFYRIGL